MPYAPRTCRTCTNTFIPPRHGNKPTWYREHCPSCRRAMDPDLIRAKAVEPHAAAKPEAGVPPITQCVLDLETFQIDRGWGVLLMGSFLIHDGSPQPEVFSLTARDYKPWQEGRRSDDSQLAKAIIEVLDPIDIIYAHNGSRFDIPWLRSLALKWDLDWREKKLIDPCSVAWRKYKVGRNSLEALADFLELDEGKMHVSPDVWRKALMDDDDESWDILVQRCESDVRVLNAVAGKVTRDVGMVNYKGSSF